MPGGPILSPCIPEAIYASDTSIYNIEPVH
jgi:hypothetical protein